MHLFSRASSPKAGDLPTPLEHSPPIPRNEMTPKRSEPNWTFPIDSNSAHSMPHFANPAGIQVRFALPYMPNGPIDPRFEQNTSLGKSRSKFFKHLDAQKSSFSNPHGPTTEPNLEYVYMDGASPYRQAPKPSQSNIFLRPSLLSNYQQNNDAQKLLAPPAYATSYFPSTKEPPVNRHSSPDYVEEFSSAFSISQHPNLEIQHGIVRSSQEQQLPKVFSTNHHRNSTPTTKHLEMMELESPVVKEKPKTLPAVIVADNSMQITKEPTHPQKELTVNQGKQ